MATLEPKYAAETAITINADGILNNTARQSTVVDNTSNLYTDAKITLKLQTGAGALASNPLILIYAYALSFGGTTYPDGITGADGSYTLYSLPNLPLIRAINVQTANTSFASDELSIAAAYGGVLPRKWGIVIVNNTGLTLAGTAGQSLLNAASFMPEQLQAV
jgi:hypothetical protein